MASHFVVQMPSESTTHIQTANSTITDDIHICGKCKQNFTDINIFIKHKQRPCNASVHSRLSSSSGTSSQVEKSVAEYVTVAARNDDGTSTTPVFRIYLEGGQANQLSAEQETSLILQHLQSQGTQESVILRSRLIGGEDLAKSLSQDCNKNKIQENISPHPRQVSRDIQMDDEDVASILANQLANEVISSVDPGLPSRGTSRYIQSVSQDLTSFEVCETQVEITTNCNQDDSPLVLGQGETCQEVFEDVNKSGRSGASQTARVKKIHECHEVGCNFRTPNVKDLVRHKRRHTGERPFACPECRQMFSRNDKLQVHQRIHAGIKPHGCSLCSYTAGDTGSLKKHMRVHNNERPYKCQICSYRSRDTSQLTVHLRTHTGDSPFVCSHESCSSAFKTNSDLTRHLRMHTGEKPFACDSCDFRCNVKSNLRTHMKQNHTVSKEVKCKVCDHVAVSKRAAKEHGKLHAEEVLKCGVCSFSTVSASGMRNHLKTHSQDKPIACKHCLYTCRFSTNLKRHLKTKHADLRAKKVGSSGQTSDGNSKLRTDASKTSAQSQRFGSKAHQCSCCDASFVREDSWRSHMRQHQSRDQSMEDNRQPAMNQNDRHTAGDSKADTKVVEDSERIYTLPDTISKHSLTSNSASIPSLENTNNLEGQLVTDLLPMAVDHDVNQMRTNDDDRIEKLPQQQILSSSTLQAQPFYVYLANEDATENEHVIAPIMFANHCHYVTIPSEQYSVSVQGGGQYVLSGPLERVGDSEVTFVQSSPTNVIEAELTTQSPVARGDPGGGMQSESSTVIKKFSRQSL